MLVSAFWWVSQLYIVTSLSLSLGYPPIPNPPLGRAEHRARLRAYWVFCCIHGNVSMSIPISQSSHLPPHQPHPVPPHASIRAFFYLVFIPNFGNRFICTISRFHICINVRCLFLSFWLASLCRPDSDSVNAPTCCTLDTIRQPFLSWTQSSQPHSPEYSMGSYVPELSGVWERPHSLA